MTQRDRLEQQQDQLIWKAKKRIVITMPIFYLPSDSIRINLACQTANLAKELGYHYVAVGGSPDAEIQTQLMNAFPNVSSERPRLPRLFPEVPMGLGVAKSQAFFWAMQYATHPMINPIPDIIVAIEPEKVDMINYIPQLVAPIISDGADVVVASRSADSFDTYPEFQARTEQEANKSLYQCTGLAVDIMFGPVAFKINTAGIYFSQGGEYLLRNMPVPDEYRQHYGTIASFANDLNVVSSYPLDFAYPLEQKTQEETEIATSGDIKKKRLYQRDSLIQAYGILAKHFNLPKDK